MNRNIDAAGRFSGADIVAVSSTMYPDRTDARFELALENAENWRDKNVPYIVVDASPADESGKWVRSAHRHRGALVVPAHTMGVATQRIQGVTYGLENGAVKFISHEPEKVKMSDFAVDISASLDDTDVLVVGRTESAMDTLPTTQRRTERLAGWILEQTHKLPPDTLSGGRGFNANGAKAILEYPANKPGFNNWIYLYDTPLYARSKGLEIGGLTVELTHPLAMHQQEDGNYAFDEKRFYQFRLQLDYLLKRSDIEPTRISRMIAHTALESIHRMNGLEIPALKDELSNLESIFAASGYVN